MGTNFRDFRDFCSFSRKFVPSKKVKSKFAKVFFTKSKEFSKFAKVFSTTKNRKIKVRKLLDNNKNKERHLGSVLLVDFKHLHIPQVLQTLQSSPKKTQKLPENTLALFPLMDMRYNKYSHNLREQSRL